MNTVNPGSATRQIFPMRIRWVSIAAGCFAGVAGSLVFGWLFALVSSALVLGAIIQPYFHRSGKWLMWLGAFILTFYVGLFLAPQMLGAIRTLPQYHDQNAIAFLCLSLMSIILLAWCDVALVIEDRKARRAPSPVE